ncbi:hypothetical protein Pelo_4249 [Pelomyxa schiedti]|nr:hypothetical protein Pelo_4249 [Pelomyxa schiedti]
MDSERGKETESEEEQEEEEDDDDTDSDYNPEVSRSSGRRRSRGRSESRGRGIKEKQSSDGDSEDPRAGKAATSASASTSASTSTAKAVKKTKAPTSQLGARYCLNTEHPLAQQFKNLLTVRRTQKVDMMGEIWEWFIDLTQKAVTRKYIGKWMHKGGAGAITLPLAMLVTEENKNGDKYNPACPELLRVLGIDCIKQHLRTIEEAIVLVWFKMDGCPKGDIQKLFEGIKQLILIPSVRVILTGVNDYECSQCNTLKFEHTTLVLQLNSEVFEIGESYGIKEFAAGGDESRQGLMNAAPVSLPAVPDKPKFSAKSLKVPPRELMVTYLMPERAAMAISALNGKTVNSVLKEDCEKTVGNIESLTVWIYFYFDGEQPYSIPPPSAFQAFGDITDYQDLTLDA